MYYIIDENYNVKIVVREDGMYRRMGTCNMCGRCCIALKVENRAENGMCKYLIDNKCSIEDVKPTHCKLSPMNPDVHNSIPECGYTWEKISKEENKNEI